MQTNLNDVKSKVMSNMAAVRDGSNIVAAMINAGIMKPKDTEEVTTEINFLRNKFLEWHLEGVEEVAKEQSQRPPPEGTDAPWSQLPITDGQKRAVFAITKSNPELMDELPEEDGLTKGIDDLTKQEASDFIGKYGKTK